jgi:ERCC4-related helicase
LNCTAGQTQKEQQATIASFFKGEFNCLVATCIAEEGLDIGEVDLIVSFDALTRYTTTTHNYNALEL